jgi:hypothetical protein
LFEIPISKLLKIGLETQFSNVFVGETPSGTLHGLLAKYSRAISGGLETGCFVPLWLRVSDPNKAIVLIRLPLF